MKQDIKKREIYKQILQVYEEVEGIIQKNRVKIDTSDNLIDLIMKTYFDSYASKQYYKDFIELKSPNDTNIVSSINTLLRDDKENALRAANFLSKSQVPNFDNKWHDYETDAQHIDKRYKYKTKLETEMARLESSKVVVTEDEDKQPGYDYTCGLGEMCNKAVKSSYSFWPFGGSNKTLKSYNKKSKGSKKIKKINLRRGKSRKGK